MPKRGQITIFIVIGMLLLLSVFFIYYMKSSMMRIEDARPKAFMSLSNDIRESAKLCMKELLEDALYEHGINESLLYSYMNSRLKGCIDDKVRALNVNIALGQYGMGLVDTGRIIYVNVTYPMKATIDDANEVFRFAEHILPYDITHRPALDGKCRAEATARYYSSDTHAYILVPKGTVMKEPDGDCLDSFIIRMNASLPSLSCFRIKYEILPGPAVFVPYAELAIRFNPGEVARVRQLYARNNIPFSESLIRVAHPVCPKCSTDFRGYWPFEYFEQYSVNADARAARIEGTTAIGRTNRADQIFAMGGCMKRTAGGHEEYRIYQNYTEECLFEMGVPGGRAGVIYKSAGEGRGSNFFSQGGCSRFDCVRGGGSLAFTFDLPNPGRYYVFVNYNCDVPCPNSSCEATGKHTVADCHNGLWISLNGQTYLGHPNHIYYDMFRDIYLRKTGNDWYLERTTSGPNGPYCKPAGAKVECSHAPPVYFETPDAGPYEVALLQRAENAPCIYGIMLVHESYYDPS